MFADCCCTTSIRIEEQGSVGDPNRPRKVTRATLDFLGVAGDYIDINLETQFPYILY